MPAIRSSRSSCETSTGLEPHRRSDVSLMLDRLLEEEATMTSRIKLRGATAKAEASVLLSFAAALLASTLLLSGCNTAEGVGDDIEEAGEEVQDAID
jgi:predicted small secreted protein